MTHPNTSAVQEEARALIESGFTSISNDAKPRNALDRGSGANVHDKSAPKSTVQRRSRASSSASDNAAGRAAVPIMAFFGATDTACAGSRPDDASHELGCGVSTDHHVKDAKRKPGSCCNCGSLDVVMHAISSMRCCRKCDAVEFVVIDNERPAKRDIPRDSTSFSFKRLSHFNEWLAQIQGKHHPSIPENVIGFVMIELRRNYINNAADVKTSQVRAILKKLKLSRYYEHVPYIISRIRGVPSERMPAHLEDNLRSMFRKIQVPFVQNSPPTRKNFLSYGYVLHKFVQLLGHNEYLEKFPLLKSRDKLRIQDDIWRRICADLHWEFVPSV